MRYAEEHLLAVLSMLSLCDVIERTASIGLRHERAVDPRHQPCQPFPAPGQRQFLDDAEGRVAGKCPELLERCQCRAGVVYGLRHVLVDRPTPS